MNETESEEASEPDWAAMARSEELTTFKLVPKKPKRSKTRKKTVPSEELERLHREWSLAIHQWLEDDIGPEEISRRHKAAWGPGRAFVAAFLAIVPPGVRLSFGDVDLRGGRWTVHWHTGNGILQCASDRTRNEGGGRG